MNNQDFFIKDIWRFNKDVIREGILNAISHRDYRDQGSIYIRQYPTKIEIESPGGFVQGVNENNIITVRSKPRNRLIHEVMKHLGFVEKSGQGADKIYKETILESKGLPYYSETDSPSLKLTISAEIKDKDFIQYLEKVTNELQINLSPKELVVLEKIREGKKIEYNLEEIDNLLRKSIIERVGNKHEFILSKKYYLKSGNLPEYSRRKGLDHETNKELLLHFMADNNGIGIMNQFFEVLKKHTPKWQINRYLKQLREEGHIKFVGNPKINKGKNMGHWKLIK